MLDEARELDWVPRLVRLRQYQREKAEEELKLNLKRNPTEKELISELNKTNYSSSNNPKATQKNQGERIIKDTQSVIKMVRLGTMDGRRETVDSFDYVHGEPHLGRNLGNKNVFDPEEVMLKKEIAEMINKGLSREEQLILRLYFYEGMSQKEIGENVVGICGARVSQKKSILIKVLKSKGEKLSRALEDYVSKYLD